MCNLLGVHRSLIYRRMKRPLITPEDPLTEAVCDSFHQSRKIYGARKIKADLARQGITISRRRVRSIMRQKKLTSVYTVKKYKAAKHCNQKNHPNLVNREFKGRRPFEVVISDLTYVRIGGQWAYLCPVVDLFNREVIGWSVGHKKQGELVQQAFLEIPYPLTAIEICHTDRGKEFDNQRIDQMMDAFTWRRSLSRKGNPWDNAVLESLNHVIKTEFIRGQSFQSIDQFKMEFFEYNYWYNHHRLHGSLGYQTPIEYRQAFEK